MSGRDRALAMAARLAHDIAVMTGGAVRFDAAALLDRSDAVALQPPGDVSPNGSCRLVAAADGWIAVNLPREDDSDLVPAWTGCRFDDPVWPAIAEAAAVESAAGFVGRGAALGLAVARLDETAVGGPAARIEQRSAAWPQKRRLRVLDLSALWAGPLCGGILAAAGHDVTKVESRSRPDPLATSAPAHDAQLNGGKRRTAIDFVPAMLAPMMRDADVIITSARPRAFEGLGLTPARLLAERRALLWIAITGHGWTGPGSARVGFGDDAAVAGGLVDWSQGRPVFAGDALADPLAGLAGARAALAAIRDGHGGLIDVALARAAAEAAA